MARDILFQEFPIKTSAFLISMGTQIDEGLSRLIVEAEAEFLKETGGRKRGIEFVRTVLKTVDRLTAEWLKENKIACQAGCSWCCLQMVSCAYAEAELIKQHLVALPNKQRQAVIKRVNQEAIYLHGLFRLVEELERRKNLFIGFTASASANVGLSVYAEYRRQLRPCPYLGLDKKCIIYPARPVDCRIAKTKFRCGPGKESSEEKPEEVRLFLDQVAVNLIMDEQRRTGRSEVIPLAGWPLMEGFRGFFKPDMKEF